MTSDVVENGIHDPACFNRVLAILEDATGNRNILYAEVIMLFIGRGKYNKIAAVKFLI